MPMQTAMGPITVVLEEEDRQAVLLALAQLSLERPGWDNMLSNIALKMDNHLPNGRPELYDRFRSINADTVR